MRWRDFTIGLLLATAAQSVPAQERLKTHRVAIVIASGPAARVDDPTSGYWQAFWVELRRLGDIEGQNLTVERYSAEGRPEAYADLAREVVNRTPDAILPLADPFRRASAQPPRRYRSSPPGLVQNTFRIWRARAATSPALQSMLALRSLESGCKSSRKPSLRRPRLQ
jgi:hypothetical protein